MRNSFGFLIATLVVIGVASRPDLSKGQVIAPSTYATGIQVQGEAEGTEFDDWADIPVALSDPQDNPGDFEGRPFIDLADIQVANDDEFLYLHVTYHNDSSVNTFVGIDIDQDLSTGFDLFELGLIGSDVGYQNDFPFQQAAGVFNINVGLTGGPLTNGGALIFPFWDQDGPEKEYAIPLDLMLGFPAGDPGFPQDTIDFVVYSDEGAGDIVDEVITYTFATLPEVDGDYNGNGVVDSADYTVWRDTLGSVGMDLAADGTGDDLLGTPDGDVDAFDYEFWRVNYGGGAAPPAVAAPEPAALFAAAWASLAAVLRRRLRAG